MLITWHTEDAFHPYSTDYIGLMSLRNLKNVTTTYASLDDLYINEETKRILFEKRYIFRPDNSHLKSFDNKEHPNIPKELLERSHRRIKDMQEHPKKVSVLFGDPNNPYIRLDPFFMDHLEEDEEAMNALNEISSTIDENLKEISLNPGDILFVDNFRAVHGRNPFKANFDGRDRWLKRLNIASDLRKSRDSRVSSYNRVIY
jgi:enduracididine beta-hydroxylase